VQPLRGVARARRLLVELARMKHHRNAQFDHEAPAQLDRELPPAIRAFGPLARSTATGLAGTDTPRPACDRFVRALAMHLCRDPHDAEDLVQDLYECTLRAPIPAGVDERRWLTRVMRNLFIDKLRRRATRREDLGVDPPPLPPDEAAPRWQSLTEDDVRAQLEQLPVAMRATFELFALEGHSYDEIAARLGIAKSTVGTRILRARERLRELLSAPR
jgi:RNA polymerase sigma-70 factor, ECF subfamily